MQTPLQLKLLFHLFLEFSLQELELLITQTVCVSQVISQGLYCSCLYMCTCTKDVKIFCTYWCVSFC